MDWARKIGYATYRQKKNHGSAVTLNSRLNEIIVKEKIRKERKEWKGEDFVCSSPSRDIRKHSSTFYLRHKEIHAKASSGIESKEDIIHINMEEKWKAELDLSLIIETNEDLKQDSLAEIVNNLGISFIKI